MYRDDWKKSAKEDAELPHKEYLEKIESMKKERLLRWEEEKRGIIARKPSQALTGGDLSLNLKPSSEPVINGASHARSAPGFGGTGGLTARTISAHAASQGGMGIGRGGGSGNRSRMVSRGSAPDDSQDFEGTENYNESADNSGKLL